MLNFMPMAPHTGSNCCIICDAGAIGLRVTNGKQVHLYCCEHCADHLRTVIKYIAEVEMYT